MKIDFEPLGTNEKHFVKDIFIRGLEVEEIIPFPVWIIPFPVSKINFESLGKSKKHFIKEVF